MKRKLGTKAGSQGDFNGMSGLHQEEEITHSQMPTPVLSGFLRISDLEMWHVTVLSMSPCQTMATPVAQLRSRNQELAPSLSLRRKAEKFWQRKVCIYFLSSGNELTRSCRSRSKYPVFLPSSLAHSQTGPSWGGRKEMHWLIFMPGQGPRKRGKLLLVCFLGTASFSPSTFLSRLMKGSQENDREQTQTDKKLLRPRKPCPDS